MKNKNLKICFAVILSFAACSLKAQSLQEKLQKEMEQRKKHANEIRLKAREQQAQLQAEKTTESNIQQQDAAGNKPQSTVLQPTTIQQKNTVIIPQLTPGTKRPLKEQKTSVNGPARKEEIKQ